MLTILVTFIILTTIGVGMAAYPGPTIGIVALAVTAMMFPLWTLVVFAAIVIAFSLLWVSV